MKRVGLPLVILLMATLPACNQRNSDKKGSGTASDQIRHTVEQEKTEAERQKEEFVRRAQAELDQLDKQMADLQAQAKTPNAKTRKQIDKSIAELEPRRKTAARKLDQLRSSSGKAWADLKDGVTAAINDLSSAYRRAASRFK